MADAPPKRCELSGRWEIVRSGPTGPTLSCIACDWDGPASLAVGEREQVPEHPFVEPPVEEPCAETGGPCNWASEEWYDDAGEMTSWDAFCLACFRWRDWSRQEMPAPAVAPPPPEEQSRACG